MQYLKYKLLIICLFFNFSSQAFVSSGEVKNISIVKLDLAAITTVTDLHETIERLFTFPSYYGKNWDAFYDCMSDVLYYSQVKLELKGMRYFSKRFPRDAKIFLNALKELKGEHPDQLSLRFN